MTSVTLTEILVVIGIMCLLTPILFPVFGRERERGSVTTIVYAGHIKIRPLDELHSRCKTNIGAAVAVWKSFS